MNNTISSPSLWQIPKVVINEQSKKNLSTLITLVGEILSKHKNIVFANSLSVEDVVLTYALVEAHKLHPNINIKYISLNTARLPIETIETTNEVEKYFNINIEQIFPEDIEIEKYKNEYGINGFYESEVAKKQCCYIRKVAPLNKTLINYEAWLSGQRQEQSATRTALSLEEQSTISNNASNKVLIKYNPLFDWTEDEVWAVTKHLNLPINSLYQRGFSSIGCEPCTRAVKYGESIRSGRWWWLNETAKECGLHINK